MTSLPDTSPQKTALSRQIIVATARRRLSEKGLEPLSVRRLAKDLGVTAPALYAHVRDKADLLQQLAVTGFDELIERYAKIEAEDPLERLRQHCLVYVDLAVSDPGLFQVMFRFRPDAIDVNAPVIELAAASEAFETPRLAIAEAVESGDIHPSHDPYLTAITLWTVAHGLASILLLGLHTEQPARGQLEDAVIGATLRGLRSPA